MKYTNKINQLHTSFSKQYKRKDETFEMGTIRCIVKDLENENYDKDSYSKENVDCMCKYLYERYCQCMSKWKERIEERKKQGLYW